MSEVFIGRQPILGRNMEIFAYELQFHLGMNPGSDTVAASAALLEQTEKEIGFQSIVGQSSAMMMLPKELIDMDNLPAFSNPGSLVLEIPNDVSRDVKVLKTLKELKSQGSFIALHDFIDDDSSVKLASISDYVKVNNEAHSEMKLKMMIDELHQQGVKVIAEKVETEEMFHYLKKLGFDLFQGHFFTNPIIINGEKLSGSKLTLLQLLAKINDSSTEYRELSEIISHDVGLSHKLLLAVNNPATMIPVKVESIADALKYMGLKRLKFWVNLLILAQMDDVPQELLVTCLTRARFCERLAEVTDQGREKDTYFLVGLLSALSAFFKAPIRPLLDEMPLSDDIKAALIEHKGDMGNALRVLKNLECTSELYAQLNYKSLGITQVGNLFLEASAWAQSIIQE